MMFKNRSIIVMQWVFLSMVMNFVGKVLSFFDIGGKAA